MNDQTICFANAIVGADLLGAPHAVASVAGCDRDGSVAEPNITPGEIEGDAKRWANYSMEIEKDSPSLILMQIGRGILPSTHAEICRSSRDSAPLVSAETFAIDS